MIKQVLFTAGLRNGSRSSCTGSCGARPLTGLESGLGCKHLPQRLCPCLGTHLEPPEHHHPSPPIPSSEQIRQREARIGRGDMRRGMGAGREGPDQEKYPSRG